jgi:hypothetical protein
MPLGRLTAWGLIQLAGRQTALPAVLGLQGPAAVVVGMLLLYAFVSRELRHPFYGLVAMALFGVSSVYQQAVFWFSASFSVLALDTALLALLAAQAWRQSGRPAYLVLSGLGAALAPAWFAIGILAGPLCTLYLLGPGKCSTRRTGALPSTLLRLAAFMPVVGSIAFLAVSLPRTAEHILHLPHYDGKTAVEAFHPAVGLLSTCRSIVDNLLLGAFGISTPLEVVCPLPLVFVVLALLVLAGVWWWRGTPHRRLLLLGLGCVLCSYLLVYSARSDGWSYERQLHTWSRYHLFPQLGLALFLCGGLPRWEGTRLRLDPAGRLSWRQAGFVGLLLGVVLLTQLPRGLIGAHKWHVPGQMAVLERIEGIDARCRRYRIDRDTARAALGELDVPGCDQRENGWQLLWGSADPLPMDAAEARRLLREGGESAQRGN